MEKKFSEMTRSEFNYLKKRAIRVDLKIQETSFSERYFSPISKRKEFDYNRWVGDYKLINRELKKKIKKQLSDEIKYRTNPQVIEWQTLLQTKLFNKKYL